MTLQNNLESAIDFHWNRGTKPPQCIIVHPDTVIKLMEELLPYLGRGMIMGPPISKDIKYKGISVYRSEDVKLNEFEIF